MSSCRLAVAVLLLGAVAVSSVPARDLPSPPASSPAPAFPGLASAPPQLRLVWLDTADCAPGTYPIATVEARTLLERLGAEVLWRRGETREIAQDGEIRVVLVPSVVESRRLPGPLLGATPTRLTGAPVAWVHVPSVVASLGLPQRRGVLSLPERRVIGIALGRVIAHEVVHVVAPAVPHGAGLMSERLGRRELAATTIQFASDVVLGMRAALRGEVSPTPPADGVLAVGGAPELPR